MAIDYKKEIKTWLIYFGTILFCIYAHEIGHCIPAWINGYQAIPTPAKEYITDQVPGDLKLYISLGGIIATFLVSFGILASYSFMDLMNPAIVAGGIANPGVYSLRYFLVGRGHDGTEFQEAQQALGLGYSGHFLDVAFMLVFLAGVILWMIKYKPGLKITGRLILGFFLTTFFIVGLQVLNNYIFDPVFGSR
jgi:hypothetical protein